MIPVVEAAVLRYGGPVTVTAADPGLPNVCVPRRSSLWRPAENAALHSLQRNPVPRVSRKFPAVERTSWATGVRRPARLFGGMRPCCFDGCSLPWP